MNLNMSEELERIESWLEYSPSVPHYAKFLPNTIGAGVKIADVYHTICYARASLLYMDLDDYGQTIAKSDYIHKQYIKSKFFFDALAYYNYAIDLSWQVLFLYYGDEDYGMLQDQYRYEKDIKTCRMSTLEKRLKSKGKSTLFEFVQAFLELPLTDSVRDEYNYLKHRGTYHVDGLGENDEYFPLELDGSTLRMINRREVDLSHWKEKLVEYDKSFVKYFSEILKVMPEDYVSSKLELLEIVSLSRRLKEWEKSKGSK
ncbi:hypothetical protein KM918_27015 [Priestia megaterium]|uniref:hypothetical protein n=1 Tax=Priestia megaterium TaxID=1404 RepID=UPI001C21D87A|nr:hypothetical protein [Priestia megaterium]MBU8690939.1 hypothetical protein [Priestia megaterium]